MKEKIIELLQTALKQLLSDQLIKDIHCVPQLQATKDIKHGDFASNVALQYTKSSTLSPKALAQAIVDRVPNNTLIEKISIAGPGFINFYINKNQDNQLITEILSQKEKLGTQSVEQPKKIHIEYISANPTGPLHVGHGRSAAYGSVVANLLKHIGHDVHTEYYVNDAGRQMDILATSIWIRYLQMHNNTIAFPTNGYKGEYIKAIAHTLVEQYNKDFYFFAGGY